MTITVLLGAGASVDAGLPTSVELTPKLLEAVGDEHQRLLQFAHAGTVMQATAKTPEPGEPTRGLVHIDVETLFNAVEALASRRQLDIGPFVAGWHPLIDEIENHEDYRDRYLQEDALRREFGRVFERVSQILQKSRHLSSSGSEFNDLVRTLIRQLSSERGASSRLRYLTEEMVRTLEGLLQVTDTDRLAYLMPLVELHKNQKGGLTVATLNYDTTIEQLGQLSSVDIDDGLDAWPGSGIAFRPDSLRLLKLHGSINWIEEHDGNVRRRTEGDTDRGEMNYARPALIFGGKNKLRPDGPYLEMLWKWRELLAAADHLVIIGYSFRDTHINSFLSSWYREDPLKRVTIVSRSFDAYNSPIRVVQVLSRYSNDRLAPYDSSTRRSYPREAPHAPVQIVRKRAGEALPELFDQIANWPPTSTERATNRANRS